MVKPTLHVYIGGSIKVSIGSAYLDVDLKSGTCTCKAWKISRIPCEHVYAAICILGLDISYYVDECFKLTCQEMIYFGTMHTLVTHDMPTIHVDGSGRDRLGLILPSFLPSLSR